VNFRSRVKFQTEPSLDGRKKADEFALYLVSGKKVCLGYWNVCIFPSNPGKLNTVVLEMGSA
jgi:hypothetical protein